MEESREQQKLYSFMQMTVYFSVVADIIINLYRRPEILKQAYVLADRLHRVIVFEDPLYTKLFTLILICLVGIGTVAKKQPDMSTKRQIVIPLCLGLLNLFGSLWILRQNTIYEGEDVLPFTNWWELAYSVSSLLGTVLTLSAIDNVSKLIKSGLGKDKWNVEGESFQQDEKLEDTPTSVNIPMQFYYRRKVRNGYINMNPFRGVVTIGTPGSGKSFGVINPCIRQLMAKNYTICLYDFKFPDLAKVAYYHYGLARSQGRMKTHSFYVINLNEVSKSKRINPLSPRYVRTLAEAQEISEALVEALKKGDRTSGSDQFFTQSAINFLACVVYFLARYEQGRYSSMPHLMALLNKSYEEIFTILLTNPELPSLLSPFMSAFHKKAFDQLEGQIGTLKIFISRLATKESFWVFSGDDFNLKISDPAHPAILVLANDPATQNINSALYALIVNRLVRLINSKGNLPTAIIADEVPTLYIHKVENLIATARSNRVAVILGLQELPQFKQQYGRETAETINAVIGNVLAGSVRNKETLDWLERLFGKVKQTGESLTIDRNRTSVGMNEKLESLIPAGKIASLKTGEMVGLIARDVDEKNRYNGQFTSSAVHCKINLDMEAIRQEEAGYKELPVFYDFQGKQEEILFANYQRINDEISQMVALILS